jgi:hypothetical protein
MDGMDPTLHKPKAANSDQYGPEVLCASWNPAVGAFAGPVEVHPEFVTEAAAADAEAFLPRFYRAQQG